MADPTIVDVLNQIVALVATLKAWFAAVIAWAAGSATGGANGDGRYPLPDGEGGTSLVPCPAKLAALAGAGGSGVVPSGVTATTGPLCVILSWSVHDDVEVWGAAGTPTSSAGMSKLATVRATTWTHHGIAGSWGYFLRSVGSTTWHAVTPIYGTARLLSGTDIADGSLTSAKLRSTEAAALSAVPTLLDAYGSLAATTTENTANINLLRAGN